MKFIRRGLGRKLVAVAESWALARGLSSLTVRSNTVRALSHRFYESLGHSRSKTQHVYSKVVTPNPENTERHQALSGVKT